MLDRVFFSFFSRFFPVKYIEIAVFDSFLQGSHKIQNLKKSKKSGFFKKSGFYYILDFFKFVFCATYVYLRIPKYNIKYTRKSNEIK